MPTKPILSPHTRNECTFIVSQNSYLQTSQSTIFGQSTKWIPHPEQIPFAQKDNQFGFWGKRSQFWQIEFGRFFYLRAIQNQRPSTMIRGHPQCCVKLFLIANSWGNFWNSSMWRRKFKDHQLWTCSLMSSLNKV
jgi:hypothetical protein